MLTVKDIENKVFKKAKIGGYDVNDVEDFLEKIIIDYERMYKENTEFNDKLENLQETIVYYKSLEQGIDQTVGNAQEEAESMVTEANMLADKIKKDAMQEISDYKQREQEKVSDQLEDLRKQVLAKEVSLEEIKKQIQIYKIKTVSMLEAQIKILNEED